MAIEFTESAGKHGFTVRDAMYAMRFARYVEKEFDDPRPPATVRPTLWLGPALSHGGVMLEVMAEVVPPETVVIFHVMQARQRHLARMSDEET